MTYRLNRQLKVALNAMIAGGVVASQVATAQDCTLDSEGCIDLGTITIIGDVHYSQPYDDPFYQDWDIRDDWDNFDDHGGSSGGGSGSGSGDAGDEPVPVDTDCIQTTLSAGPFTLSEAESFNNRNDAYETFIQTAAATAAGLVGSAGGPFIGAGATLAGGTIAGALVDFPDVHCGDVIKVMTSICALGEPEPDDLLPDNYTLSVDSTTLHYHGSCIDDIGIPDPGHVNQ